MARVAVAPGGGMQHPDDDNEGPLRIAGYEDSEVDWVADRRGWVTVVFELSRHLNKFEDQLNQQDAEHSNQVARFTGNVVRVDSRADDVVDTVTHLNHYLTKLEQRGKEASEARYAVVAEARERLAEITFD